HPEAALQGVPQHRRQGRRPTRSRVRRGDGHTRVRAGAASVHRREHRPVAGDRRLQGSRPVVGRDHRTLRVRQFFRGAAEAAIRDLARRSGTPGEAASRPDQRDEDRRAAARELLAREHPEREQRTEPEPDAVLLDFYASRYGWDWERVERTDFWWV